MPKKQLIDLAALSPAERLMLADVLHDGAMQEIARCPLTAEQLDELDDRIREFEEARVPVIAWTLAQFDPEGER